MMYPTQSYIGRDWRGQEVITIVYQTTFTVEAFLGGTIEVHDFDEFRVETRWQAFRRWFRYLIP